MKMISADKLKQLAGVQALNDDELAFVSGGDGFDYVGCTNKADAAYDTCNNVLRRGIAECTAEYEAALDTCTAGYFESIGKPLT